MNGRKRTVLTALAGVLTVGEFGSAVEIGLGKEPGGAVFAVVFGVFFGLATWLLRRGRVTAGAVFTGLLDLSLKTVQNHVSRILDKLQAADRTQAVPRARQAGHGA